MASIKNIINGSLKSKLVELIRLNGPMTVANYMKIVLLNPEKGFYMNNDVFGVKGHFTTNPEISQIFGEILGAWIFQEWRRFDCPAPLRLVEFGPGRGTLMSDITRTLKTFKKNGDDIHTQLIEMSPHLKSIQSSNLKDVTKNIEWFTSIDGIEKEQQGFTAYIAHEFLDALPIQKFVRDPTTKRWRELLIDYDKNYDLRFCISRQPSLSTHLLIPENFLGDHIEVCPEAVIQLEKVVTRLNNSGKGCMLICDYGFEEKSEIEESDEISKRLITLKPTRASRDTFRAFKNHQLWPPLQDPGEADLTADVDFGYIKSQLKNKATLFGTVDQASFLTKCGLYERLKVLTNAANEEGKEELISGANMLINDMGKRYRFLSIFPKDTEPLFKEDPPAGFNVS